MVVLVLWLLTKDDNTPGNSVLLYVFTCEVSSPNFYTFFLPPHYDFSRMCLLGCLTVFHDLLPACGCAELHLFLIRKPRVCEGKY